MNLTIKRDFYRTDGIFSTCLDENNEVVMVTLEHAYGDNPLPKVPPGTYTCRRGPHRLHGMTEDFETFEVEGVDGHDNILFHWGNYNKDSEGCFIVGELVLHSKTDDWMLSNSRKTFQKFMALQEGLETFELVVIAGCTS